MKKNYLNLILFLLAALLLPSCNDDEYEDKYGYGCIDQGMQKHDRVPKAEPCGLRKRDIEVEEHQREQDCKCDSSYKLVFSK